jgi:hypothetical protein
MTTGAEAIDRELALIREQRVRIRAILARTQEDQ